MIKTVDLHKSFIIEGQPEPLHVLKGVNEHIEKGEVVSIINLLEVPEKGQIFFEGVDITAKGIDIDVYRQKMGMVFQHFNVFPHLSVAENITLAPVLTKKKTQAEADEMAKELLARVGLLDKWSEHPGRLSGGQKQRLGGNIAEEGTPEQVFNHPQNPRTAEFLSKVLY